ncbi:hypothetical protein SAMN05216374_0995 [Tardiphaga sp. OK246]|uniref:hypothetical protein n=1 Tax=Tardiphaga sp. OK246 TaxID=1855307 RepID=UPI000B707AFD|nr:hypothetical protein [Tardiphaga sp. OK246]SNS36614.1 hypothetical protein SAMN05216374_0995 [Tardiphaga sp. OK246]
MSESSKPAGKVIHLRCSEAVAVALGAVGASISVKDLQRECWARRISHTVIAIFTDAGNDYFWHCDAEQKA